MDIFQNKQSIINLTEFQVEKSQLYSTYESNNANHQRFLKMCHYPSYASKLIQLRKH